MSSLCLCDVCCANTCGVSTDWMFMCVRNLRSCTVMSLYIVCGVSSYFALSSVTDRYEVFINTVVVF